MFTPPRSKCHAALIRLLAVMTVLTAMISVPALHAADSDDFDSYKLRISAFWFHSNPSGNIRGKGEDGLIDFQKDLGFTSYSTFSGKVDWKFTRKNHLYLTVGPFNQSRQVVLDRTIVFQGQTFDLGLTTESDLSSLNIAPGYQYDIIRRKRGHLGLGVQLNLFNATATINAAAQVTGDGVHHDSVSATGSLLAPIPVVGPQFRLYLTNSPRLFLEGNVYGMYFFGYGNFVSTADTIGLSLTKNLSVKAGYQVGSRLVVNNSSDRIGLQLTQQGAIFGMEISF